MWKARRSQTQEEKEPYKSPEQGRNEEKSGPRVYQARINLRVGKVGESLFGGRAWASRGLPSQGRAEDLRIPASERSGVRLLPISASFGSGGRRRVLWSRTERVMAVLMRYGESLRSAFISFVC
ncbi:Hypothetical predicted protein [Cloeon dipterum]|uniref:Uncharacterized protein n=1 Tax=Cloeon dipterum TaxID=197152 RepID=A0A8S1DAI3_9INSE|nr:Hypothetical predicted protein [Cloeon dipterum]